MLQYESRACRLWPSSERLPRQPSAELVQEIFCGASLTLAGLIPGLRKRLVEPEALLIVKLVTSVDHGELHDCTLRQLRRFIYDQPALPYLSLERLHDPQC
jgi:hypothetical protein